MQVLYDIWIEAFFKSYPEIEAAISAVVIEDSTCCADSHNDRIAVLESVNIQDAFIEFDKKHSKNPMYKWLRMYIQQVMIILQFLRATLLSLWSFNLVALEKMCILYFSFNRLDYAQNIPE